MRRHSFENPDKLRSVLKDRGKAEGGCLVYTWSRYPSGYGKIAVDGRTALVHRVAWQLAHGPIPGGMVIMHTCDNPSCFNVEHLRLGTQAENIADKIAKGRAFSGPERVRMSLEQQRRQRERAAQDAGVPFDWHRCPQCGEWKPRDQYGPNAQRRDGRSLYCVPCARAYRRRHRR